MFQVKERRTPQKIPTPDLQTHPQKVTTYQPQCHFRVSTHLWNFRERKKRKQIMGYSV